MGDLDQIMSKSRYPMREKDIDEQSVPASFRSADLD
jgi:hypothetical protein